MAESMIRFDELTGRWEILRTDVGALSELTGIADGVQVAYSSTGELGLVLVDVEVLDNVPREVREVVDAAFGVGTWDSMTGHGPLSPATTSSAPILEPVPHEPGIPERSGPDRYVVDDGGDVITIRVDSATIEVEVPRVAGREWVRVARADSGVTVALGRVRTAEDGSGSTRVSYGLPIPVTDLHFDVTSSPLEPLPDRATRRRRWAEGLIRSARRRWLRRPLLSLRDARLARIVSVGLRDRILVDESRRLARRAVLSMGIRVLIGLAVGLGILLVGRDESGDSMMPPTPASIASTDPSTTVSTTVSTTAVSPPVEVSSAVYTYTDGSNLNVSLVENTDGSPALVVTDVQLSVSGFGRDPARPDEPIDVEKYRQTCLNAVELDAPFLAGFMKKNSSYDVYLVRADGSDDERFPVATRRATLSVVHQSVEPQECRETTAGPDGTFEVDVTITLEEVTIPLDTGRPGVTPGFWRVVIDRVAVDGSLLVQRTRESLIVKIP